MEKIDLLKKEYAQLKLYKNDINESNVSFLTEQILKEGSLILKSHQLFVKNLINPNTPYTRLLVKHETGTGKTIATLAMALPFIEYYKQSYKLLSDKEVFITPSIFIIGFSKHIFQKEILRRPEFGFITRSEMYDYKKLKYLADTGGEHEKQAYQEFESKLKKRLIKKSKGGFFKFYGYKEFFNRLFIFKNKNVDEQQLSEIDILNGLKAGNILLNLELIDSFANSFIICDEIHNVYNSSEINNYGIALKILFNIYDSPDTMQNIINLNGKTANGQDRLYVLRNSALRAVLASATPINNSPTEIVDLLNLLIPITNLPKQEFLNKSDFFLDNRNLKPDALDKIKKLINGYVSYLRDANPKYFPEKIFEGKEIIIPEKLLKERVTFYHNKIIPYLKFIRCPMSEFHQKTYDAVYRGTLPPDGQSLIDIVLPNPGLLNNEEDTKEKIGIFKTKDIKYSLTHADQNWLDKNQISMQKSDMGINIITGEFMNYKTLAKYSSKYAKMMEDIFKNLNDDEGKIVINHQYVKMSGILFIQEVLKRNGIIDEFSSPTDETLCSRCGINLGKHKGEHDYIPTRFIMYYGEIDKTSLDKSLDKFNSPDNIDGYSYRILIGSKVINEGLDLNCVRNIWVMVAPANIPTLIQILGRAIRQYSHNLLPPEKRVARIRIYTSANNKKELSYEENKYFEKSQDYLVIQQIEKAFNEMAVDAPIHREIIFPDNIKSNLSELGTLYYPERNIVDPTTKNVKLDTFRIFYSDEEIKNIIYIIKRLFIEQSPVWYINDLWQSIQNPPFEIYFNTKLILEENFLIALYAMTNKNIDTYKQNDNSTIEKLFDSLDRKIVYQGRECKIVKINDYYILFPLTEIDSNVSDINLGLNSTAITGIPDIDIDSWLRPSYSIKNTSLKITKNLKTSNISYNQLKFKFYNQYRNYEIYELPVSTEIYDLDFHINLVEDAIRYVFNILTNPDMQFSELHEFYFKMIYFYDKLDLILFAESIEDTKHYDIYKKYITDKDLQINFYDVVEKKDNRKKEKDTEKEKKKKEKKKKEKYNAFLMSSIQKSSKTVTFNIKRLNNFLGRMSEKSSRSKIPKLEDINISRQLTIKTTKIRKVLANMLPVGHLLTSNNELVVPKLYNPEMDPEITLESNISLKNKMHPWIKVYDIHQELHDMVENDYIIGYYEKSQTGIDVKFKLRLPVQKLETKDDARMGEKGAACSTRKKEELIEIAKKLDINDNIENMSIKNICNNIKLKLMKLEMKERRKVKNIPGYKQIRYFYLHFEPQL